MLILSSQFNVPQLGEAGDGKAQIAAAFVCVFFLIFLAGSRISDNFTLPFSLAGPMYLWFFFYFMNQFVIGLEDISVIICPHCHERLVHMSLEDHLPNCTEYE